MSEIETHQTTNNNNNNYYNDDNTKPYFSGMTTLVYFRCQTTFGNCHKFYCDALRLTYDVPDLLHVVAPQWQQWLGTPDCPHP